MYGHAPRMLMGEVAPCCTMTRMWLGSPASATIMAFSQASCEMRSEADRGVVEGGAGAFLSSSLPAAISAILIIFLVWKGLPDTRCMGLLV